MKTRFQSTNFLTNVITLLFITLGIQNIQFTIEPGEAINEILAQNWDYIGNILLPALSGLLFKIIQKVKEKTWDWKKVIKSTNFWTQAITVFAGVLAGVGILLPENAAPELATAIFSGSVVTIITSVFANVLTPLWHFFKDRNKEV